MKHAEGASDVWPVGSKFPSPLGSSLYAAGGEMSVQPDSPTRFDRLASESDELKVRQPWNPVAPNQRGKMAPSLDLRSKTSDWKVGRLR